MRVRWAALAFLGLSIWPAFVRAQAAIAFAPIIGQIPDGVTLNVTPVVSADRRYVRMTLNPQFIAFIQFDSFSIPAIVAGRGNGGGIGGGFNSVAVPQGLDAPMTADGLPALAESIRQVIPPRKARGPMKTLKSAGEGPGGTPR